MFPVSCDWGQEWSKRQIYTLMCVCVHMCAYVCRMYVCMHMHVCEDCMCGMSEGRRMQEKGEGKNRKRYMCIYVEGACDHLSVKRETLYILLYFSAPCYLVPLRVSLSEPGGILADSSPLQLVLLSFPQNSWDTGMPGQA